MAATRRNTLMTWVCLEVTCTGGVESDEEWNGAWEKREEQRQRGEKGKRDEGRGGTKDKLTKG